MCTKTHEINKTLGMFFTLNAHTTNAEKIDVVWVGVLGKEEGMGAYTCMLAV